MSRGRLVLAAEKKEKRRARAAVTFDLGGLPEDVLGSECGKELDAIEAELLGDPIEDEIDHHSPKE